MTGLDKSGPSQHNISLPSRLVQKFSNLGKTQDYTGDSETWNQIWLLWRTEIQLGLQFSHGHSAVSLKRKQNLKPSKGSRTLVKQSLHPTLTPLLSISKPLLHFKLVWNYACFQLKAYMLYLLTGFIFY